MTNAYQVLGIRNFASEKEIRAAYRKMSKRYHPDLHRGDAYYEERFKEIQAAYAMLSTLERRMETNRILRQESTRNRPTRPAATSPKPPQPEAKPCDRTKPAPTEHSRNYYIAAAALFTLATVLVASYFALTGTPRPPVQRQYFTIHDTPYEVETLQGPPTGIVRMMAANQEIRYYGLSSVTFEHGRVSEYADVGRNLRVSYFAPIRRTDTGGSFTIGSTRSDVFAAQGSPTVVMRFKALNQEIWQYGNTRITFEKGRVTGFATVF